MWTKRPGPSRRVVACAGPCPPRHSAPGVRASRRVSGLAPTVFTEFSALAQRSGAVNLGQGFPDFDGAEAVREAAVQALRSGHNQYAPGVGAVALRRAVAAHAARFQGLTVDPDTEVVVTCGATEAIFDAVQGLVDVGDEVVTFEPVYDSYAASVAMAGGVLRRGDAPAARRPPSAVVVRSPARWRRPSPPAPGWCSSTPRTTPPGRSSPAEELEQIAAALPPMERGGGGRRGVPAPGLRRGAPRLAGHAAGDGRAARSP